MNEKLTVYKILNKVTSKYYIGSSVDFEVRKLEHIGMLRNKKHHNKFLQYDWNKYGESNFDFLPIKQGFFNVEQMVLHEYELIINTFDLNYNIDKQNYLISKSKKKSKSKNVTGKHSNFIYCDPKKVTAIKKKKNINKVKTFNHANSLIEAKKAREERQNKNRL